MGQEKILLRLKQIQNLINQLDEIAPSPERYFQDSLQKVATLHAQLTVTSSPEKMKEESISSALHQQLLTIEEVVFQRVVQHLQETANKYSIPGHYELKQPLNSEEPALQLIALVNNFKKHALQNEAYSQNLKLVQRQSVPENSNGLPPKSAAQKKKNKSKKVEIEEDSSNPAPSLAGKIHKLLSNLETLATEVTTPNLSTTEIDDILQQDFILNPLLTTHKEKAESVRKRLIDAKKEVRRCIEQVDYHEIIIRTLEQATDSIEQLNKEMKSLHPHILSRQALLTPSTQDLGELKQNLVHVQEELFTTLETFLINTSNLNIANKTDSESKFFRAQLVLFIEELQKEFKGRNLPVNLAAVENIRIKFLQHLGEKTSFFNFKVTVQPLIVDDINRLLKDLLASGFSSNSAILKMQLAATKHIIAKIQAFPLSAIKKFNTLMTLAEDNHQEICKIHQPIPEEATSGLLPALQKHLDLFARQSTEFSSVARAKEIKAELHLFLKEFNRFSLSYNEAEINQRAEISSLLGQFRAAQTGGEVDWHGLQQIVSQLQKVIGRQQHDLNVLSKLTNRFNELKILTFQCIEALNNEYTYQKAQMSHEIEDIFIDAEAALEMQHEGEEIAREKLKNEIAEKMAAPVAFLAKLKTTSDSLNNLFFHKNALKARLQGQIDESKFTLKHKLSPAIRDSNQSFYGFSSPVLNNLNPFKEELEQTVQHTADAVSDMNNVYQQLDITPGRNLKQWLQHLNHKFQIADEMLKARDRTYNNASVIEQRLQSKAYQTSLAVLETLHNEFLRIIKGHINKAITKYPNDPELTNVHADVANNTLNMNTNWKKELLDKIDPRLTILLSMYLEFHRINSNYICRNLATYNDKTYLDNLVNMVETHLHNNHMENISEGKRSTFIQRIRVHILRPLQTASHHFINYLKQNESAKYRFFTTLFACKTERKLVEIGNEVYDALKPLSSTAAA